MRRPSSVIGDVDEILQPVKILHLLRHGFFDFLFQVLHVVYLDLHRLARAGDSGPYHFSFSTRVAKIAAHRLLHALTAAEQPQHDEQGHHRSDEVGIGDFPCPAMMSAMALSSFS